MTEAGVTRHWVRIVAIVISERVSSTVVILIIGAAIIRDVLANEYHDVHGLRAMFECYEEVPTGRTWDVHALLHH